MNLGTVIGTASWISSVHDEARHR